MIKNLFLLFWAVAFLTTMSKAQVSSVTGQYLQDNNLLLNPGFESGIGKWTNSTGTFTADYSVFVQGKASGKVVLSSQAMDFYQDSTIFASQLADGMQAILTVKIKSNVAGVRVCPRQAGVLITSLCVSVQGNDKWGLYQIPFVTGATSQGISINSNGNSITGTVYVDESYVGVSNILNSSSEAKLAGEAYFAGTTGCNWTRTSTTVGAFAAVAACPGPTIVSQNLGAWQTTDSNLPRVTVNNLPAGTYKAKFLVRHNLATGGNSAFSINDGTTTCEPQYGISGAASIYTFINVECTFNYTSAGNRVFELYAGSSANTITISSDTAASPRISSKFILEYYGSNTTYTTTAGINNVDVFSAKVSSADVVSEENVNWINGNCTNATLGQSTCVFNSGIFTITPNCIANNTSTATSNVSCVTGNGTSGQVDVFCRNVNTSTAVDVAFTLSCQKQGADFVASKTITGTFNEVMTTPGIAKPKTCYYAFGGASATLASPTECTTGTCVEVVDTCGTGSAPTWATTAIYQNMTFASGTFANSSLVTCSCVAWDLTSGQDRQCDPYFNGNTSWASNSTGGLNFNLLSTNSAGTQATAYLQIKCEGTAP